MFFFLSDEDDSVANKKSEIERVQINQIDYDNIIVLKPFIWIQLNENSHMNSISINIVLEVISKDMTDIVEANRNDIRTLIRNVTGTMRWMELRKPEGKLKYKYILINKINSLFSDVVIRNLYLTHLIMR